MRGALKLRWTRANILAAYSTPTMHRMIGRGLIRPNRSLRHLFNAFLKVFLDFFRVNVLRYFANFWSLLLEFVIFLLPAVPRLVRHTCIADYYAGMLTNYARPTSFTYIYAHT
jgi:hypothetical protein